MKGKSLILVIVILSLALSGFVPLARPAEANAQPQLLALAAGQPDAIVNVIVQKSSRDARAEQAVEALGGQVTRELSMINALVGRLPALAAVQLSTQPGVKWVSLDAPAVKSSISPKKRPTSTINTGNAYRASIRAAQLQAERPELTGEGVTVAVVDSGITDLPDLGGRVLANVVINGAPDQPGDGYGHGTHIAGIIGSSGEYAGVAPGVNLINVKVSDDQGGGTIADVVAGLQWVYDNKEAYNIRVVNLSINSSVIEHYTVSPLDAAVEVLWFNGVVVVVSSGNNGKQRGILYPPANDPFVITVGAVDDQGTPSLYDDTMASFSAYGRVSGFYKPEILAPGSDIYSLLSSPENTIAVGHPGQVVDGDTLRLSGTSMSAAVTSGAVALLLQSEPNLTPDQVKYRLMNSGRQTYGSIRSRYLDIRAAVNTPTWQSANTGYRVSSLLAEGDQVITMWDSVAWNSVAWNSVAWNSVAWNSVAWNSVAWNSLTWDNEQ